MHFLITTQQVAKSSYDRNIEYVKYQPVLSTHKKQVMTAGNISKNLSFPPNYLMSAAYYVIVATKKHVPRGNS